MAACGFALSACGGAYIEADAPGVAVETYPQTYYDGHVVYLIGDRWYVHDGPRWVYYRHEPTALYSYRMRVRSAPPAQREFRVRDDRRVYREREGVRREASPVRREAAPARREASPARRVD